MCARRVRDMRIRTSALVCLGPLAATSAYDMVVVVLRIACLRGQSTVDGCGGRTTHSEYGFDGVDERLPSCFA